MLGLNVLVLMQPVFADCPPVCSHVEPIAAYFLTGKYTEAPWHLFVLPHLGDHVCLGARSQDVKAPRR